MSLIGTKRTCRGEAPMSAFRDKADVLFLTRSGRPMRLSPVAARDICCSLFSIRQGLGDFTRVVDEELRDRTEGAILEGDDAGGRPRNWQLDRQHLQAHAWRGEAQKHAAWTPRK